MPSISWSTLNSALDPTPSFRFSCTLPTLDQAADSPAAQGGKSAVGPENISLYVERFTAPMGTLDVESVPFQSGTRNFPSGAATDSMSIVFLEDTALSASQFFLNWRALVRDTKGNFGLPSKYKQAISITPMDLQGSDVGTLSWASCWPTHVSLSDFDGSASGYTTLSVTFAVDVDDFTLNGGTGSGSGGAGSGGPSGAPTGTSVTPSPSETSKSDGGGGLSGSSLTEIPLSNFGR